MNPPRPRGRPRTFDEDRLLDALLDTFWAKGFGGASLDDLAAAAGVKRQSLYLAFGDKEAMYLKAMARFASLLEAAFTQAFTPGRPLAEGLGAFYLQSLEHYLSGDGAPRGCFVLCTAPVEAPSVPAVRAALFGLLGRIDAAFERRFCAAADAGELAPTANPAALAGLAAAALHSLAIRARAGFDRAALEAFVAETVTALAPPPPR